MTAILGSDQNLNFTVMENPKFEKWISKLNDIFQNFVSAFPFLFFSQIIGCNHVHGKF